ncbi:hypothetical protein FPV67DRAFT_1452797 [Lyophyllum atratum]|nr:hypothetical protein FPV67DRAFT_1452797 [Lyophyllum atratum]
MTQTLKGTLPVGSTNNLEAISIINLPQEIFCEIFAVVYGDYGDGDRRVYASVLLSHVCTYWRDIVLDLPWLWENVSITKYDHEVLTDVFLRSKGRPLDICVCFPNPTPEGATFGLWKTLIALGSEMWRVHTLTISAFNAVYRLIGNAFGNQIKTPLLTHLTLRSLEKDRDLKGECLSLVPMTFEHNVITHLAVEGVAPPSIDLSKVKTLIIKRLGTRSMDGRFPAENALERLYMSSNDVFPWNRGMTVIPRLAHVTFDRQNPFSFSNSSWITPALTSLTISHPSVANWDDWQRCLSRPPHPPRFATLKTLTLAHCDTEQMAQCLDLRALIQATPELTKLKFKEALPEPILKIYTQCPWGWPHLTDIYVGGVTMKDEVTIAASWKSQKAMRERLEGIP